MSWFLHTAGRIGHAIAVMANVVDTHLSADPLRARSVRLLRTTSCIAVSSSAA